MRNSPLRKIICWLLVCVMVQPTFGQETSIMLYYKPGINNVSFKYNGAHDSLNPINVNTEEYSDSTIVKVAENNMGSGKKSDLSSYASDYINNLQLFNHMVGLDTKNVTPGQLNFWVNGSLSINGKQVSPLFSLGMLSGYWWYGSRYGNRYIGNNDVTDKGLDIADTSGTSYCLKEPSSNSDELFVYNSSCSEAGGNYAADSGKDKQQSFSFVYGPDIKSISFDVVNNQSEDGSGHKLSNNAIQTDNQGSLTKVTVTAGEVGSLGTANTFDHILGYMAPSMDMSHILQLMSAKDPEAHTPAAPVKQNLWLTGKLKINGQLVKGIIVLGHNSESNTNWWIGSTNGTRYDSPSNSGLNVVGADDGQAYCINSSQTNYQAVVTTGACNDYSPNYGRAVSSMLRFEYANSHITSVIFTPSSESAYSPTYISKDGTGNPLPYGAFSSIGSRTYFLDARIVIGAGSSGSYGTACDFNSLINNDPLHALEVTDRRKSSAHKLSLPQNMNFWIKGSLKIESYVVSQNFIIGHSGASDQNWWIASPDGNRFDSNTNSGMNVRYVDTHGVAHHYCLNQSTLNYQLVVSDGICSSKPQTRNFNMPEWLFITCVVALVVTLFVACAVLSEGGWKECMPHKLVFRFVMFVGEGASVVGGLAADGLAAAGEAIFGAEAAAEAGELGTLFSDIDMGYGSQIDLEDERWRAAPGMPDEPIISPEEMDQEHQRVMENKPKRRQMKVIDTNKPPALSPPPEQPKVFPDLIEDDDGSGLPREPQPVSQGAAPEGQQVVTGSKRFTSPYGQAGDLLNFNLEDAEAGGGGAHPSSRVRSIDSNLTLPTGGDDGVGSSTALGPQPFSQGAAEGEVRVFGNSEVSLSSEVRTIYFPEERGARISRRSEEFQLRYVPGGPEAEIASGSGSTVYLIPGEDYNDDALYNASGGDSTLHFDQDLSN